MVSSFNGLFSDLRGRLAPPLLVTRRAHRSSRCRFDGVSPSCSGRACLLAVGPRCADDPPAARTTRDRLGRGPLGRTRARTRASPRTRPNSPALGSSITSTSASSRCTPRCASARSVASSTVFLWFLPNPWVNAPFFYASPLSELLAAWGLRLRRSWRSTCESLGRPGVEGFWLLRDSG